MFLCGETSRPAWHKQPAAGRSSTAVLVMAKQALDAKVITKAEYNKIEKAETLRDQAVQVDNFEPKAYKDMR